MRNQTNQEERRGVGKAPSNTRAKSSHKKKGGGGGGGIKPREAKSRVTTKKKKKKKRNLSEPGPFLITMFLRPFQSFAIRTSLPGGACWRVPQRASTHAVGAEFSGRTGPLEHVSDGARSYAPRAEFSQLHRGAVVLIFGIEFMEDFPIHQFVDDLFPTVDLHVGIREPGHEAAKPIPIKVKNRSGETQHGDTASDAASEDNSEARLGAMRSGWEWHVEESSKAR